MDSPLRDLFDVTDLVDMHVNGQIPHYRHAASSAAKYFADCAEGGGPIPTAVHSICLRPDGKIWLVRFGPKGGAKKLWEFGTL